MRIMVLSPHRQRIANDARCNEEKCDSSEDHLGAVFSGDMAAESRVHIVTLRRQAGVEIRHRFVKVDVARGEVVGLQVHGSPMELIAALIFFCVAGIS